MDALSLVINFCRFCFVPLHPFLSHMTHINKTFFDLIPTHFHALLVVCDGAWLEEDLSNALLNNLCQIMSICNILHACKHTSYFSEEGPAIAADASS